MRAAARLFASVKNGKYLEPNAPTGLTGLVTHPSPRSTLLYHYKSTLDKLKLIPESSVYRQSTEALTKARLQIIESSKPAGWDEWQERIQVKVAEDPEAFRVVSSGSGSSIYLPKQRSNDERTRSAEWDGEAAKAAFPEGVRSSKERASHTRKLKGLPGYKVERQLSDLNLEPEPQYTVEAIADLESRLGAGLIEEVIQVAEGEHKLVVEMIESRVWEPLEEQAPEGQWVYFERGH